MVVIGSASVRRRPAPPPPLRLLRRSVLMVPGHPEQSFSLLHFLGWLHVQAVLRQRA